MTEEKYCSCPYCEAIFRLPKNKNQSQSGIVRCGACREIFDSNQNLMRPSGDQFVPITTISAPTQESQEDKPIPTSINDGDPDSSDFELFDNNKVATQYPDEDLNIGTDADLNIGDDEESWQQDIAYMDKIIKDIQIDDVKNPFEDVVDTEPEFSATKSSNRQEPVFTPLNLDDDPENSLSPSEATQDLSQKSDLGETLFPESVNYMDDFDSELNLNLITSGVTQLDDASLAEDSFIDSNFTEDAPLSRMSRNGVDDYLADRKNPIAMGVWFLVVAGFVFLLGAQVRYFLVDKYAQDESLRPYLLAFCTVANCQLPARRDAFKYALTHTKIDLHPNHPGAIRVTVKMINEAEFAQPFPDLQLTLTDKVGRVVGRRTFSPGLYLEKNPEKLLGSGELSSVLFDLARPHEKAVGFVVDIVTDSAT